MTRRKHRTSSRFNWYILLACALLFIVGGTLAGVAAIILHAHVGPYVVSMLLCVGLYAAAVCAFQSMENC